MNEIKESAKAYTRGALIGGIALATFALITKRRVVLWGTIGVLGGGFIAYKMKESSGEGKKIESNFKNYDAEPK